MTKLEWLACTAPSRMLNFLRGRASERKLRLFACACCRLARHLLSAECWKALETAEAFADGQMAQIDLDAAHATAEASRAVSQIVLDILLEVATAYAEDAVASATSSSATFRPYMVDFATEYDLHSAVVTAVNLIACAFVGASRAGPDCDAIQSRQCVLLRDTFGHLWHPDAISPTWLGWNDGTVPKLAQTIYNDRDFALMPILADALEDAGCDNADILTHCRQPGEHVRGCWVIDLLLGKQ